MHINQRRERVRQKEEMVRARIEFEKEQESARVAFRQQQQQLKQEGDGQSKKLHLDNFEALTLENSLEVRVLTLTYMSCNYLFREKKKKTKKTKKSKKTKWSRKVRP